MIHLSYSDLLKAQQVVPTVYTVGTGERRYVIVHDQITIDYYMELDRAWFEERNDNNIEEIYVNDIQFGKVTPKATIDLSNIVRGVNTKTHLYTPKTDREYSYIQMFNAFKEEYRRNADRLLTKINALRLQCNLDMHTNVSFNINSGFRNPIHNAKYAPNSQHLTGNAIDIRDVNGSLAMWCLNHINIINNDYNFSMECPLKTNGWVHLDNRPVRANPNPIKMLNRTKNAKCNACNSCPRF